MHTIEWHPNAFQHRINNGENEKMWTVSGVFGRRYNYMIFGNWFDHRPDYDLLTFIRTAHTHKIERAHKKTTQKSISKTFMIAEIM